jgi:hypothetical protein
MSTETSPMMPSILIFGRVSFGAGSASEFNPSVPTHSFAFCFDYGQGFLGSVGCPCEELRVLVRCSIHSWIASSSSVTLRASDALTRDLGEEPLDEPRAGCSREVKLETLTPGEPAFHPLCLVRGVIETGFSARPRRKARASASRSIE